MGLLKHIKHDNDLRSCVLELFKKLSLALCGIQK